MGGGLCPSVIIPKLTKPAENVSENFSHPHTGQPLSPFTAFYCVFIRRRVSLKCAAKEKPQQDRVSKACPTRSYRGWIPDSVSSQALT